MSSKLALNLTRYYSINFDLPKRDKKKNYFYNLTLYRYEKRICSNSKTL